MVQIPMQKGAEHIMSSVPFSWRDRCAQRFRKATCLIGLITPSVMTKDWSFKDCQDYLVELKMATSGAIMSLRLANNDFNSSQNDHQITCLNTWTKEARVLAFQLRQRHLDVMLGNAGPSAQVYGGLRPRGTEPQ
jgi:hypothetical protein